MSDREIWLGVCASVALAFLASRLPKQRLYRPAGFVHRRTLATAGTAPMHWHDRADASHLTLFTREGRDGR